VASRKFGIRAKAVSLDSLRAVYRIRIVERRSGIGEGGRSSLEGLRLLEESVVGREEDQAFGERAARQGGATSDRSLQHIPVPLFWFGTTCNNTSKSWFPRIPGAKFVPSGQVDLSLFIYILCVKIIPSSEAETLRVAFWHHVPILNEPSPSKTQAPYKARNHISP
jgi:hypothetical protein